jgi:hypothetical protein
MAIGKRKSKIVTFRLSAAEYEALSESCVSAGASSISEFARLAVLDRSRMVSSPRITITGDLTSLGNALSDLDSVLNDASTKIRKVLGIAVSEASSNAHS